MLCGRCTRSAHSLCKCTASEHPAMCCVLPSNLTVKMHAALADRVLGWVAPDIVEAMYIVGTDGCFRRTSHAPGCVLNLMLWMLVTVNVEQHCVCAGAQAGQRHEGAGRAAEGRGELAGLCSGLQLRHSLGSCPQGELIHFCIPLATRLHAAWTLASERCAIWKSILAACVRRCTCEHSQCTSHLPENSGSCRLCTCAR